MTVQSEGEISSVSSFVSASVAVFVSAALTIVCVCVCVRCQPFKSTPTRIAANKPG